MDCQVRRGETVAGESSTSRPEIEDEHTCNENAEGYLEEMQLVIPPHLQVSQVS